MFPDAEETATASGVAGREAVGRSTLRVTGALIWAIFDTVIGLLSNVSRTTSANPTNSKIVTTVEIRRNDVDSTPENSFLIELWIK